MRLTAQVILPFVDVPLDSLKNSHLPFTALLEDPSLEAAMTTARRAVELARTLLDASLAELDLEEAILTYRRLLGVCEPANPNWAPAQMNLAVALSLRGDSASREEAVATMLEVSAVLSRRHAPEQWARSQQLLGKLLVERNGENGAEDLEGAIAAFRRALRVWRRETAPQRWAETTVELPSGVLSRPTVLAFNSLLWHRHPRRARRGIVDPDGFFYPLDSIRGWNKMYGPRGFTQYQCILPKPGAGAAARRFLELLTGLSHLGGASFLCVVKDCGEEGEGLLSFPRPGVSIALDVPMGERTQELVDRLNERVLDEGGRIYLAKDALTRPEHFRAMEGERLERFQRVRREHDPEGRIRSAQSVRLMGDRGPSSGRRGGGS